MKKTCFYFFTVILLFNFAGCATTRTVSHFLSAKSALESGDYEKAVVACQEALESNQGESPLTLTMDGKSGINADYFSRLCLGAAYTMLGDMDKAKENIHKSIPFYPEKAFLGYLLLADVYYKYNQIDVAYQYSLKARETVGTPRYYEIMKRSPHLDRDTWLSAVEASIAFFELRIDYKMMERQLAMGNKKKAMQLAEKILNRRHFVYFSANGHDTYLDMVNKGGMADLNGLMIGDKVLKVNNRPVTTEKEMMIELSKIFPRYGDTVTYKIERNGRSIDLEAKLVYPEIEATKIILQDLRANKSDSFRYIEKVDSKGPWLKILEPKAARGVKIVSNQNATFVILASGNDKIMSVTVNGKNCSALEADVLEKTFLPEPDNTKKYSVDLPLVQGKNRFVISVVDSRGRKTQKTVNIEGSQAETKKIAKLYDRKIAVIIGINRYLSTDYDTLDFAVNDAQSIKEKITKIGFDKVIEIPEYNATRAGILRVLADELPYALNKSDALFVYFAGHGDTEMLKNGEPEGYILPRDAKKSNYRGTAISMEKIREVIKRYKAKHILLVFDSCYSGYGAIPKTVGKSSYPHDAVQIITAGGKSETAAEDASAGHGVFTRSFLDAFENKSLYNGDGIILASDIGHYVKKEVSKRTGGKQNPQSRYIEGEGDFRFEYYD